MSAFVGNAGLPCPFPPRQKAMGETFPQKQPSAYPGLLRSPQSPDTRSVKGCVKLPRMLTFESPRKNLVPQAVALVRRLREGGHVAYFAGGCVRDALRGAQVKDIDIATSATPEAVAALFPSRSVGVGRSFGVMLVTLGGIPYDVATFRTDGGYQDGRHPDTVVYDTAEHDALRRDFTVNALFYDPLEGRLIDFVGGEADLRAGLLRTVGDPSRRFREDRLRLLRAVRFAAVCGWRIAPPTWLALKAEAGNLGCVSAERIRTEFLRTLCEAQKPSEAMELLAEGGLLGQFLPEALALRGCPQDPVWHPEGDVWTHTMRMLDLMETRPRVPTLAWAALLHDIGKPRALRVGRKTDGSPWYRTPCHAAIGATMVPAILRRLKESRETIEAVTAAVRHHMQFAELPRMRESTLRRMLGRTTMPLELELHRLDCLSSHAKLDLYNLACAKLAQYAAEPILPPPAVTGKDLLAFGYQPGPALGRRLKTLYSRQLEGASRGTLLSDAILSAPADPAHPRKAAFAFAPNAPFPLRTLWERLCRHSGWDVTLIVLPGRYWGEPHDPNRRVLRLVGDCAGNVTWPTPGAYDLLFIPDVPGLPSELETLAPLRLRVQETWTE